MSDCHFGILPVNYPDPEGKGFGAAAPPHYFQYNLMKYVGLSGQQVAKSPTSLRGPIEHYKFSPLYNDISVLCKQFSLTMESLKLYE